MAISKAFRRKLIYVKNVLIKRFSILIIFSLKKFHFKDNFHEDPHAQLQWHKNIPKFEDEKVQVSGPIRRKGTDTEHGESGELYFWFFICPRINVLF